MFPKHTNKTETGWEVEEDAIGVVLESIVCCGASNSLATAAGDGHGIEEGSSSHGSWSPKTKCASSSSR